MYNYIRSHSLFPSPSRTHTRLFIFILWPHHVCDLNAHAKLYRLHLNRLRLFLSLSLSIPFRGMPCTFGCGCGRRCCCRFAWFILLLFGINYLIYTDFSLIIVFVISNAPYHSTHSHYHKIFLPFHFIPHTHGHTQNAPHCCVCPLHVCNFEYIQ